MYPLGIYKKTWDEEPAEGAGSQKLAIPNLEIQIVQTDTQQLLKTCYQAVYIAWFHFFLNF